MERSYQFGTSLLTFVLGLIVLPGLEAPDLRAQDRFDATEDRIAAVVEERVITLSDLRWLIAFRDFQIPEDPPQQRAFYTEILDQLINQTLILRETAKTPFIQVTPTELDRFTASYQSRFPSAEAYQDQLREMGMREEELRDLLGRQLAVNKFIELRFEPFIIVLPGEVKAYYDSTYSSELLETGQSPPPIELVEETIRQILTVQRTTDELEKWVQNTRHAASIQLLLPGPESDNTTPPQADSPPLQRLFPLSRTPDSNPGPASPGRH